MGYYTRMYGSIAFTPALPIEAGDFLKQEFPTLTYAADLNMFGMDCEQTGETKAYYFEPELTKLMEFLKECSVSAHGIIECFGEESTDIYRYVVTGNEFVNEKARITWPDGVEVRETY